MATNLLVLLHGMNPHPEAQRPDGIYDAFWAALRAARPELARGMDNPVKVEWGHQLSNDEPAPVRDDHQLTLAEQFAYDQVGYGNIRKIEDRNNVLRRGLETDFGIPIFHQKLGQIRESVVLFGLSDVVYYCSADGEARVRQQVYEQVLGRLEAHRNEDEIRLHVFAHSLGVTIAHDFLFGLFNRDPNYKPGFVEDQQGSAEGVARFKQWRERAQAGKLTLGGFASAASQLPLLLMRSQKTVRRLYDAKRSTNAKNAAVGIDPADIGIRPTQRTQWKIFYDTDDVLGFATRGLYSLPDGSSHPAIMDFQVNCGYEPLNAHLGYWTDPTVIHETAQLFSSWMA